MDVFLGGVGGEEKAPGHGHQGRSLDDTRFQTDPFCYILYVDQWGFHCSMSSDHREGGPRSSIPWAQLRTVKGLLHLVPSRTPRSSVYDVYAHVVYVVTCYMSVICIRVLYVGIFCMSVTCYMSVICLCLLDFR